MVDLHWVVESTKDQPSKAASVRSIGNCIIAGLLYLNSYGGRPGEWELLQRVKVIVVAAKQLQALP